MEDFIKINDFALHMRAGTPFTFIGKHSGQSLSAIKLEFTITRQDHIKEFEKLLDQKTVNIYDPFVKRSYEAKLKQNSYSYQEGRPERHYSAEISELDLPPKFKKLEIEGQTFHVLEYFESDHQDDVIGRHAVLKLTKEQFADFPNLLKPGSIEIKRIEIDEEPLVVRYGGAKFWSEHKEGEELYYKHIVRFFPADYPAPKRSYEGIYKDNLERIVLELTIRFEALLNYLVQKNILTDELRFSIVGTNWDGLIDDDRINEICQELERVNDASEWLGPQKEA